MLDQADAALIIGDPALRIEPNSLQLFVLDLGQEWTEMTSLPMVFALWAGPTQFVTDDHRAAFAGSCRFGLEHLEEIIAVSQKERNLSEAVIRTYLTHHIAFELGPDDLRGLDKFWSYSAELE